jgi:phosphatidylglycerophosphate synthase
MKLFQIQRGLINVPNTLSVIRLLGVPLLFWLVYLESAVWFVSWFVILGLTDYFDGFLARRWNQATEFGSFLDAIADVAYYMSAAWFLIYLFPEYLQPNIPHIIGMLVIFSVSVFIAKVKAGSFRFLHTHLSRLSGVLVFFGFLASFAMDTTWVIRGIIWIYALAFVEISAMFWIYGNIDPDTRSILHLRKNDRR